MINEKKNATAADVTPEMIKEWKERYPKGVNKITAGDKACFIKSPTRKELGYAGSGSNSKDPLAYTEAILKACWLAGDPEILTEDSLFLAASGKVTELISVAEASVEKL